MDIFILLVLIIIGAIINKIMQKKKKEQIKFDEFDDIQKIKQQEMKEKQEMEYESEVLNQVYEDTYNNSNESNLYDIMKAHLNAQKEVEKAKEDLYNFKVLDSVEVEEDDTEGNQISKLKENGYDFDIELFKKWSRQIFGCIKLGTEEQLEVVKNFISEELYDKLEYQRMQFAKDGLEFVTEDLLIEKCKLYDYGKSMSKEELKILINASMKEYIIQKSTNEIIRGSNSNSYNKNIIMTFTKQNIEDKEGLVHNCPNCGVEVAQTKLGKCNNCNTLVLPIRYNWTLTKFETM